MTPDEADRDNESVFNAIQQGFDAPNAIAIQLSLDAKQVRKAINRLIFAGRIRRKNQGGYELARNSTLVDTWK